MTSVKIISSCKNGRKTGDKSEQTRTQIASWIQRVAGIHAESGADREDDSADKKRFETSRSAAEMIFRFLITELF